MVGAYHVNRAWEDSQGNVWLASASLGDTADWIEHYKGERAFKRLDELDFTNFKKSRPGTSLQNRSPHVHERLKDYEKVVSERSTDSMPLKIQYCSSKNFFSSASFRKSSQEI